MTNSLKIKLAKKFLIYTYENDYQNSIVEMYLEHNSSYVGYNYYSSLSSISDNEIFYNYVIFDNKFLLDVYESNKDDIYFYIKNIKKIM